VGSFVSGLGSIDLAELVGRAQSDPNNDSAEMNEIIRRFDPLAIKIGKQLTPDWMLQDDLANAARLGLVKAVRKFNQKSAFAAYAKTYMAYAAKRELTWWKRSAAPEGSKPLHEIEDGEEVTGAVFKAVLDAPLPADRTWGSARVARLVSNLSQPQRVVLELAFIEDFTVSEIAAMESVSPAAISQRKTRALTMIERDIVAA